MSNTQQRNFTKSNVKYLTLTAKQINERVEKRNKERETNPKLPNAITLDLINKLPQSIKAKEHKIQYYRLAIWNEDTETYMPFKINKGVFTVGGRPKGEWGEKKKELLAANPTKKWEDLSIEERGPPNYFKIMFNCKMYDPLTLTEVVTKEFAENPINKDLKPSEYNYKLEKYLIYIRDEQDWILCHLNIHDATSEIFSKDNGEWLYDNLNKYTLPEAFRSHVQTLCNANEEVMAKLKKSDPKKWRSVVENKGLIELEHPVGWIRTKMNYENPNQLITNFRDATNRGPNNQPRMAVSGSFSKPKVLKPLDYSNFNYWLNPGSFCVNNVCEIRAMTSNKGPTTHCYWYDATVRTVASTKKEYQMDDDDRDILDALGYGVTTQNNTLDELDDNEECKEDNPSTENLGSDIQSLKDIGNLLITDE